MRSSRYGMKRLEPFTGQGMPLIDFRLLSVRSTFNRSLVRVTVLHMAVTRTPESRLAGLQRSKALVGFGALLCAFVVAIHVADQGGLTAMADPPYKGYLFYALEIGGATAALLLITRRLATAGWVLGLGVSIGPASGYVLSRSVGLPGYADDIGNWMEPLGVASLVVEGSLFVCALIALIADHRVFAAELRALARHAPSPDGLFGLASPRTSDRARPSPPASHERESLSVPKPRVEQADDHLRDPQQGGKWVVAEAAWVVRHSGPEQLASFEHTARAHSLGLLLDTLRLNWVGLPEQVRHQALSTCRELTGESAGAVPRVPSASPVTSTEHDNAGLRGHRERHLSPEWGSGYHY